jgi:hypothetical protein
VKAAFLAKKVDGVRREFLRADELRRIAEAMVSTYRQIGTKGIVELKVVMEGSGRYRAGAQGVCEKRLRVNGTRKLEKGAEIL